MARRANIPESVTGSDRTLVLYTTLILILVSFFVVLLSRANFDETKYSEARSSIQRTFGSFSGGRSAIGVEDQGLPDMSQGLEESGHMMLEELEMAQIRALLAPAILNREARIIHTRDKRVVSLSADLLFDPDSNEVADSMVQTLAAFAAIVGDSQVDISIEGHTSNLPAQSSGAGDNWAISSRRALAVMEVLLQQGLDSQRLEAFGYGGTRPLHSNSTPIGRARNSRVDLVMDFSRVKNVQARDVDRSNFQYRGFDFQVEPEEGGL